MGTGIVEMIFSEPPDDWSMEQFDTYTMRLINMYKPVAFFMNIGDGKENFKLADALHEKIWKFLDARIAKFTDTGVVYPHG
jgi:hypothetical protein